MSDTEWTDSVSAAETYERVLVPTLFQQWVPITLEAGDISKGDNLLDVACGTGVVARHAVDLVGASGTVAGVDLTGSMLTVAERIEPTVDWRLGDAAALPFADESFDLVVCQAGLMFFDDQVGAIREMKRVLRPGGRLVVHVWAHCDAIEAFSDLLETHVGEAAAENFRTPWNLKDAAELRSVIRTGGFAETSVATYPGDVSYRSIDEFLEGATGILVSANVNNQHMRSATEQALQQYLGPDGTLTFPEPAHIAVAEKPAIRP
jgi:SAM-dependent methyltransferase